MCVGTDNIQSRAVVDATETFLEDCHDSWRLHGRVFLWQSWWQGAGGTGEGGGGERRGGGQSARGCYWFRIWIHVGHYHSTGPASHHTHTRTHARTYTRTQSMYSILCRPKNILVWNFMKCVQNEFENEMIIILINLINVINFQVELTYTSQISFTLLLCKERVWSIHVPVVLPIEESYGRAILI